MKHITEYKTLGITFAPALGGNHIANMISTSPYVQNRFKGTDNYEQYLIDLYTGSNGVGFHAQEFLNVNSEDYTKAYDLVSKNQLSTVLPGHMEDVYWVFNHLKPLGNIGFITIEVFDIDIFNFYKDVPKRSYVTNYNPHIYRFMYTKNVVSKLLDIPLDDGHVIDAGKIIQSDITEVLHNLNDALQLNMNLELCKELHSIRHKKAY
jgi:hypothetical protein